MEVKEASINYYLDKLFTSIENKNIRNVRESINFLFAHGGNLDYVNYDDYNALQVAINTMSPSIEIIKLLIDNNIDINYQGGKNELTPLMIASDLCHENVVDILLNYDDLDLTLLDSNGNNIFQHILEKNKYEINTVNRLKRLKIYKKINEYLNEIKLFTANKRLEAIKGLHSRLGKYSTLYKIPNDLLVKIITKELSSDESSSYDKPLKRQKTDKKGSGKKKQLTKKRKNLKVNLK